MSASCDLQPQHPPRQYSDSTLAYFHVYSNTVSTVHYEFIRTFYYATIRLHPHTVLLHSTYNLILETIRLLPHHVHGRASLIISDQIIVSHTSPWEILAVLDTILPICLDLTYFTFTQYSTVYRDKSASVSVSTHVLSEQQQQDDAHVAFADELIDAGDVASQGETMSVETPEGRLDHPDIEQSRRDLSLIHI